MQFVHPCLLIRVIHEWIFMLANRPSWSFGGWLGVIQRFTGTTSVVLLGGNSNAVVLGGGSVNFRVGRSHGGGEGCMIVNSVLCHRPKVDAGRRCMKILFFNMG
eukprot:scaffold2293_cov81-Skeletonema_dohrnii-CCMP3373.AAC.2